MAFDQFIYHYKLREITTVMETDKSDLDFFFSHFVELQQHIQCNPQVESREGGVYARVTPTFSIDPRLK